MRKIIASLGIVIVALAASACTSGGTDVQQQEQNTQQNDTTTLDNNQPIPHYNYSQIRQTLIDAENIAADGTQTTSFFFQMGDPDPVFICPSIGVPVANTAQLSNPQQVVGTGNNNAVTVGQQDPFGIYSPAASTGTYVVCVDAAGQKYLQYWEGDVMSVTAAATWDRATHSVKVIGAPTYQPKTRS